MSLERLWVIECGYVDDETFTSEWVEVPIARLTEKSVFVADGDYLMSPRDQRRLDRASLERDGVYDWSASRRYGCHAQSQTYYTDAGKADAAALQGTEATPFP
jgi:hypothetical protein